MLLNNFSTRCSHLERLDLGQYTPEEYARWQSEMWYLHRFFGEVRAIKHSLIADMKGNSQKPISVLDVGAGNGGLLFALKRRLRGLNILTVGVETNDLSFAPMLESGIDAVKANGLELPFGDASFDYVMCSLCLHHFDEVGAISLLREMGRVAKRRIYVIDLDRRRLPYYLYRFFGYFLLQTFTLDDGSLSIRRAYRPNELIRMAQAADLRSATVTRSAINRLILTANGNNE